MAEWPNAAVLKTADPQGSGGSNPSPSARSFPGRDRLRPGQAGIQCPLLDCVERWPSGRRRQIANLLWGYNAPPRVRIPASPPALLFLLGLALLGGACGNPRILVQSRPCPATLYLDSTRRGRTPLRLEGRFPGERALEVVAPGHRRQEILTDLRPSLPVLLFPLDFPFELGRALFGAGERALTLDLEPAPATRVERPQEEEIRGFARRARALGLRRGE